MLSIPPTSPGIRGRSVAPAAFFVSVANPNAELGDIEIVLHMAAHPALTAVAVQAGAQPRARGWVLEGGDLTRLLKALPLSHMVPRVRTVARARGRLLNVPRHQLAFEMRDLIRDHPCWPDIRDTPTAELGRRATATRTEGGLIILGRDGDRLEFQVALYEPLRQGDQELWLGVLGKSPSDARLNLPEALDWLDAAQAAGIPVFDDTGGGFLELARRLDHSVTVVPVRGAPGLSLVTTGRARKLRQIVPASEGVDHAADHKGEASVADTVADVAAMDQADPIKRGDLHDYQAAFVAQYLASEYGILNALDPGMGKTVCAVGALRERGPDSHSLVVVPSPLREQWREELGRYHPHAELLVALHGSDLDQLPAFLIAPGPKVVVVSYELARRHVDALAVHAWDDLVVDEGDFLRRTSARTRALWKLRGSSRSAMVLTATPFQHHLDEMGPLVGFSRGDDQLFAGAPLSSRVHHGLTNVLGPTVFRASSERLPDTTWRTHPVALSSVELELHASLLVRLGDALERRGGMSGVVVARMLNLCRAAACDPAALAAKYIPPGLREQMPGRDDGIPEDTPSKRTEVLDIIGGHRGQALIFTDFANAAIALAGELARHNLPAVAITSRVSAARRQKLIEAFTAGQGPRTLVLSASSRVGLNLQSADLVVHYDLPTTAASVAQRVGRARRLGGRDHIDVVSLVATGTIDECLLPAVEAAASGDFFEIAAQSAAHTSVTALAARAYRQLTEPEQLAA